MDEEVKKVIYNLDQLCDFGNRIRVYGKAEESDFIPWRAEAIHLLLKYFDKNDLMVATFINSVNAPIKKDIDIGVNVLTRIRSQLSNGIMVIYPNDPRPPLTRMVSDIQPRDDFILQRTKKVFIVHGHDESMRDAVSNYVHKLGLDPIILADEASEGKTLIEKLEEWNDVGFAIVLLTPDDVGGKTRDQLKTRARQNVIFELGLFIGWLKRKNVCPISKSVQDLPSDYMGVVFIQYDREWKLSLVRELQKSGFKIDSSKV